MSLPVPGQLLPGRCCPGSPDSRPPGVNHRGQRGRYPARRRNCDRTHPAAVSHQSHRTAPDCYQYATARQTAPLLWRGTL